MIVDDHPEFRQIVKALLQQPGVEFLECNDGEEAVRIYPVFQPDMVLMDVAMKRMDGIAAAQKLTNAFPGARVHMLSEYDDPDMRSAALKAGALDYLLKEDLSPVLLTVAKAGIPRSSNPPPERGYSGPARPT